MSYTNSDGLLVLTNGAQGEVNLTGGAEYGVKYLVINIADATTIGSSAAAPAANDSFIPAGAYITRASLIVFGCLYWCNCCSEHWFANCCWCSY
jgi:hypothetical protein